MHVQNQAAWPTGIRAKFSHGPRDNRDAGFNFDPQVIAIASIVSTTYVGTSVQSDTLSTLLRHALRRRIGR